MPTTAYEITKENEHEFVTTTNCNGNGCPEDSACSNILDSKGAYICICYHFGVEPLRKNEKCRRKTVFAPNAGAGRTRTYHHRIHVVKNSCNVKQVTGTPLPMTFNAAAIWPPMDHNHSVIPVHVVKGPGSKPFPEGIENNGATAYMSMTLVIAVVAACIFSILLTTLCFIKRKNIRQILRSNHSKSKEMKNTLQGNGLLLPVDRFVNNPTYETTCVDLAIRVFSPEEINLMAQIGQGCFGKVFKGELNGDEIAVKVVKTEYSDEAMKEVETMATFSHPNILHLIGIVRNSDTEAPWLIFEFMEHGDLASVLRSSSKKFPVASMSTAFRNENDTAVEQQKCQLDLSTESLMDFASQIAEGMSYLSSQHFVHRDLAARNCLVSSNGMVKISDFGLSRDVYTCDYYKIGGSRLLPLRWMAPESILYGRFTLESDVWAYGVLLWEIFTWGKQPYYGHSNEEVVQLILDGVLLCPPSDCPPQICQVMAGCWKTEPKDRFTFKHICQKLQTKDGGKMENNPDRPRKPQVPNLNWIDSGYEVPKSILKLEYMEVV